MSPALVSAQRLLPFPPCFNAGLGDSYGGGGGVRPLGAAGMPVFAFGFAFPLGYTPDELDGALMASNTLGGGPFGGAGLRLVFFFCSVVLQGASGSRFGSGGVVPRAGLIVAPPVLVDLCFFGSRS